MIPRKLRRWCCFLICLVLCASMCMEALAYTGVSSWATAEVEAAEARYDFEPLILKAVGGIETKDFKLNGTGV